MKNIKKKNIHKGGAKTSTRTALGHTDTGRTTVRLSSKKTHKSSSNTGYLLGSNASIEQEDPIYDYFKNHTHSLESIILSDFTIININKIIIEKKTNDINNDNTTLEEGKILKLSKKSALLLCSIYKINRVVFYKSENEYKYVENLDYDNGNNYYLECLSLETNKDNKSSHKGGGIYDILLYKYQDPVVRMVCEYMILLYDIFFVSKTYNINFIYEKLKAYKKMQQYNNLNQYQYNTLYVRNGFWTFVRSILMGEPNTINIKARKSWLSILNKKLQNNLSKKNNNIKKASLEGTICKFGKGLVNCCEDTFHNYFFPPDDYMNIRTLFNEETLKLYDKMKSDEKYKSYQNLDVEGSQYQTLFNINYSNINSKEIDKKLNTAKIEELGKFIEICQETIKIIIISSGRAEGKVKKIKNGNEIPHKPNPYPPISLIEVFDKINKKDISTYVWIIRSERFHVSKSPCVHFGLNGHDITDKLTSFFCLETNYETNVILHSIGHCLDRLYCGHIFKSDNYSEANNVILIQILKCFEIFLSKMKNKYRENPSYDDPNFKKLNINNLTKETLFLVSINDSDNLKTFMESNESLPPIYKNSEETINDLYNINYSLSKDNDTYTINDECLDIKKIYGCSPKLIRDTDTGTGINIMKKSLEKILVDFII
jgi:hypothetical protein